MIMLYFQCHAFCGILSRMLLEFFNENITFLCCNNIFSSPLSKGMYFASWLFLKAPLMIAWIHSTPTFDSYLPPYLLGSGNEPNRWLFRTFSSCWAWCQGLSLDHLIESSQYLYEIWCHFNQHFASEETDIKMLSYLPQVTRADK